MRFAKYHALGNDYLVLVGERTLSAEQAQRICDRHRGVGSDGLLLEEPAELTTGFGFRVINPDGSEAEVSGNGARIFARYLFDQGRVGTTPFDLVSSSGRRLRAQVISPDWIQVAMGVAVIGEVNTPLAGPYPAGWCYTRVSIGNPHAVVFLPVVNRALAEAWGPILERDERFPQRTNVQLAVVRDAAHVDAWIWERGAGYTEASGSSACAVVAAGQALALLAERVHVRMPGGELSVERANGGELLQTGPVAMVAMGEIARELFDPRR
jgi:diaminopimelate epimerase